MTPRPTNIDYTIYFKFFAINDVNYFKNKSTKQNLINITELLKKKWYEKNQKPH